MLLNVLLVVGMAIASIVMYSKWSRRQEIKDMKRRAQELAKQRNIENPKTIYDLPCSGEGFALAKDLSKNLPRILDRNLENYSKLGMNRSKLPGKPHFIQCEDPDIVEYILKTNFANYEKGEYPGIDNLRDFLGNGIFNSDGEQWKKQRSTASHLFTIRELKSMVAVFSKHTQTVLTIIEQNLGKEIDVQDLFARFTLDSFGEIAFGVDVGSLHKDVPFSKALDTVNAAAFKRFMNPFWKLTRHWEQGEKDAMKSIGFINEFVYNLIQERRKDSADKEDLISYYVRLINNGEQPPAEDKELRDFVVNFIIAGRDTTAALLTWSCGELARNPEKFDKLVSEIDTLEGATPDYENVKNLKYLKAVFDETLRLWPPVPANARQTINDDFLPGGVFVPAKSRIGYSLWAIGRNPAYWDNPNAFVPERFLEKLKKPNAWMPFHFGNRICLGQNMAILEARIMMSNLLQKYTFKLAPGQEITYGVSTTLKAKNGIKLIFSHKN